ncbi:hypothetical protein TKK_0013288 [Trichogramma kaykai]|uniref:Uncharacterized protein n=1 Tax=Trichogramma kaykai TaxID=54128 RepID=A0ABD2WIF8_9HYME
MYRQILVYRDNVDWQRVLWRANPSETVGEYRCTTVTYGTAAALFLALHVIKQLADDGCHDYPEAARVLSHQLYVDDIFFEADSVGGAISARDQLIGLLATAGMKLAKWAASDSSIIQDLGTSSPENKDGRGRLESWIKVDSRAGLLHHPLGTRDDAIVSHASVDLVEAFEDVRPIGVARAGARHRKGALAGCLSGQYGLGCSHLIAFGAALGGVLHSTA